MRGVTNEKNYINILIDIGACYNGMFRYAATTGGF